MVRPAGLEPATLGLEGRCSIQMSYGRISRLPEQENDLTREIVSAGTFSDLVIEITPGNFCGHTIQFELHMSRV